MTRETHKALAGHNHWARETCHLMLKMRSVSSLNWGKKGKITIHQKEEKNSIPLYTWHNLHFKNHTILTLTVHCILIKAKDLKTEGTLYCKPVSLHILQEEKKRHTTGKVWKLRGWKMKRFYSGSEHAILKELVVIPANTGITNKYLMSGVKEETL